MKLNIQEIQSYLATMLQTHVEVFDDSYLHYTHSSYQVQKAYIRILLPKQNKDRINFQRKVMKLAAQICNQPIHSIEIISTEQQ